MGSSRVRSTQRSEGHSEFLHPSTAPHNGHVGSKGKLIFSAGDPDSVIEDLNPTIKTDAVPELLEIVAAPKGVRFVVAKVRKITEWRHLFCLHASTKIKDQLLTHSRHGSVTVLQSETPLGRRTSPATARTTNRRITGAHCLGRHHLTTMQHCPNAASRQERMCP